MLSELQRKVEIAAEMVGASEKVNRKSLNFSSKFVKFL